MKALLEQYYNAIEKFNKEERCFDFFQWSVSLFSVENSSAKTFSSTWPVDSSRLLLSVQEWDSCDFCSVPAAHPPHTIDVEEEAEEAKGWGRILTDKGFSRKTGLLSSIQPALPSSSEFQFPQNGSSVPLPQRAKQRNSLLGSKNAVCFKVLPPGLKNVRLDWITCTEREGNANRGRHAGISTEHSGSWGTFARGQGLGPTGDSRSVSQGMHRWLVVQSVLGTQTHPAENPHGTHVIFRNSTTKLLTRSHCQGILVFYTSKEDANQKEMLEVKILEIQS